MRKLAALFAVVLGVVFCAGLALAAPPDKAVLKISDKLTKPAVAFDHKGHGEKVKACKECHHADAAGSEQKCGKCHGEKAEGKKATLKEAFHTQCKDCHKKMAKGPQKCDECHKK